MVHELALLDFGLVAVVPAASRRPTTLFTQRTALLTEGGNERHRPRCPSHPVALPIPRCPQADREAMVSATIHLANRDRSLRLTSPAPLCSVAPQADREAMVSATIHLANRDWSALVDDFIALGFLPRNSDKGGCFT